MDYANYVFFTVGTGLLSRWRHLEEACLDELVLRLGGVGVEFEDTQAA